VGLKLRDRFLSPAVARAATSPSGIVLAGVGVSAGIVIGLPVAAIGALGAAAWAGRVLLSVPRAPSRAKVDPFTLGEPWRSYVRDTQQARSRFTEAVERVPEGPLHERLGEIAERVDNGADEAWRTARDAQSQSEARKDIDVADITSQLSRIQADADETWAAGSNLAATAEALESQLASAARLDTTIADAESRLRLLDARLDEAVTRTIELSARARDPERLPGLEADIDSVVSELESLRAALDETGVENPGTIPDGFPSRPIMRRPDSGGGTATPG
jgi:hypothetical protein